MRLAWRAARQVPQGRGLGRPRRLHRLRAVRRRVPDGHRHPRRIPARMHRLRPVHRRLQRGHGQDRPAAELIAYDSERNQELLAARRRRLPARAPAHAALRRRAGAWSALVMLAALGLRSTVGGRRPARSQPAVRDLADGSIRNGYSLRMMNKAHGEAFELTVPAMDGQLTSGAGRRPATACGWRPAGRRGDLPCVPAVAARGGDQGAEELTFELKRRRRRAGRGPSAPCSAGPSDDAPAGRGRARHLDPVGFVASSSWSRPSTG